MKPVCVVGIDPGAKGAVTFLYPNEGWLEVFDMPVFHTHKSRTRTFVDGDRLATLVREREPVGGQVEDVWARLGDGVAQAGAFMEGYGVVKGVLAALGVKHDLVTPQVWKKALRVPTAKQEAKARAIELFPQCASLFTRPDKAEAALLGLYWLLAHGFKLSKNFIPKPA